jgi:type III secretion protein R
MVSMGPDLIFALVVLGLLPFILIGVTAFTKFAVVLGILRNAMGVQQIPPNMVLYSMALIMTFYVMLPTAIEAGTVIEATMRAGQPVLSQTQEIVKPFLQFMNAHTNPDEVEFFQETAKKLWGEKLANQLTGENATNVSKLIVTMPAFLVSELTKAFQIGFMLFLPFLVIDLIIANILLALGMNTLSPVTVSLPFKILFFIGLNGWQRLLEALAQSYI